MTMLQVLNDVRLHGNSDKARARVGILIEAGIIKEIRRGGFPEAPAGALVHELGGRTVLPGMTIGHYHASYHRLGAVPLPVGMEAPPGLQTLRGARALRQLLDTGFTGAVSAGSPHAIDAALDLALNEGLIEGPRFVPCGRDVSTTGHSQDSYLPWYWESGFTGAINRADGPDEMRRAVREEVKRGARIVKLFVTGGHGVATPGERMEMSADELEAAITTAHERGARARGHIANRQAIKLALDYGIDVIDHGDGLDRAAIERLVATGTFLVPSMFYPTRYIAANPGPRAESMKRELEAMRPILQEANQAGVRLVLGDDYGTAVLPHGMYGAELKFYVDEIGIPALDVLRWATEHGGAMLDAERGPGRLEPGRVADLSIVDGDPVADIGILADTARVVMVMKGGALVKNDLDNRKVTT